MKQCTGISNISNDVFSNPLLSNWTLFCVRKQKRVISCYFEVGRRYVVIIRTGHVTSNEKLSFSERLLVTQSDCTRNCEKNIKYCRTVCYITHLHGNSQMIEIAQNYARNRYSRLVFAKHYDKE